MSRIREAMFILLSNSKRPFRKSGAAVAVYRRRPASADFLTGDSVHQRQFKQFALECHGPGQTALQLVEPLCMQLEFFLPGIGIDRGQLFKLLAVRDSKLPKPLAE